jgi:hypothetical protein
MGCAWRPGGAGGMGGRAAGAVGADGGAVGFPATRGARARKKWPMGRLSVWAWVGTVEPGSAKTELKYLFF